MPGQSGQDAGTAHPQHQRYSGLRRVCDVLLGLALLRCALRSNVGRNRGDLFLEIGVCFAGTSAEEGRYECVERRDKLA